MPTEGFCRPDDKVQARAFRRGLRLGLDARTIIASIDNQNTTGRPCPSLVAAVRDRRGEATAPPHQTLGETNRHSASMISSSAVARSGGTVSPKHLTAWRGNVLNRSAD